MGTGDTAPLLPIERLLDKYFLPTEQLESDELTRVAESYGEHVIPRIGSKLNSRRGKLLVGSYQWRVGKGDSGCFLACECAQDNEASVRREVEEAGIQEAHIADHG